jgi:methionyl-tRNA formyltransferase
MKALIVTSQVTYVPTNGLDFLTSLLDTARPHLAGLVLLRNLSPRLLSDAVGLAALGCGGIAGNLVSNMAGLPWDGRKRLALRAEIPLRIFDSMNDPEVVEWVRSAGIDLVVNARTRCIYRSAILAAPRMGCINIHHGILPDYRGTLCDLYALSEGRRAGFTIHRMNEKIDAGSILVREQVSEPGERNYPRYLKAAGCREGKALGALLNQVALEGHLPDGEPNITAAPVYTRNPTRAQIRIMKKARMVL